MPKSLIFIFIVFMMAKFYFKKICFKRHRMTSPHKIVINVDISMLLTWNFQITFKTKFGSLKNCGSPKACRNFSILKEKFWQGKVYPFPWRIGLVLRIIKINFENTYFWTIPMIIIQVKLFRICSFESICSKKF